MGNITNGQPKCLLKLYSGETIFERQLRILSECGINEIIVTTGNNEATLKKTADIFPNIKFTFVNNPDYDSTNYIYSLYLSEEYIDDDILSLHGDLVFNKGLIEAMLESKEPSLCLVNKKIEQPQKDFKCRLKNNLLCEVSVNIFDDDCFAFQPLYKLFHRDARMWIDEVSRFVDKGYKNVYAENALNEALKDMKIKAMSYENNYINEIDTYDDLVKVQFEIEQFDNGNLYNYNQLSCLIEEIGAKKAFAVCGKHIIGSEIDKHLSSLPIDVYKYFDIQENPSYESIRIAVDKFNEEKCDLLISIGGGSAIDTAKGIKYFCGDNDTPIDITHIAIPTTAGSGSEATRFAVMYRNGIKQSLEHELLLPEYSVLDIRLLYSLSDNQRKISLLDALCQCIESLTSINATIESKKYAVKGIELILQNYKAYIIGDRTVYGSILTASNHSGKAINISKTTIGHAMSYQLTSKFGVKHGQAVAICLISAMKYCEKKFCDSHKEFFDELADIMNCEKNQMPSEKLLSIYKEMDLSKPLKLSSIAPKELAENVDSDRLSNFIFKLSYDDLNYIYSDMLLD